MALILIVGVGTLAGSAGPSYARNHFRRPQAVRLGSVTRAQPSTTPSGPTGPAAAYDCNFNLATDAFTGADATASAIGWEGNHQGVVTCLGGTFVVQNGLNQNYGFGIYTGAPTTWVDADGYLPAQITTFRRARAVVAITEFADRVVIGGNAFVAVYARVEVTNPTNRQVDADPQPSPGLVPIDTAPTRVQPHTSVAHDYVVAADRFGNDYPWPSAQALADAGELRHALRAHAQLLERAAGRHRRASTSRIRSLDNAYRSGFIYTQIARSGDDLNTGVNGYESEFSHDVIGILTNLFTQGYFADAHALLSRRATWSGPRASTSTVCGPIRCRGRSYLLKTGDIGFVQANFAHRDPRTPPTEHRGSRPPDRRRPDRAVGDMEATDDIDTHGYWTVDDYEALLGLAAYRYVATSIGNTARRRGRRASTTACCRRPTRCSPATIGQYHSDYLPCSIIQPNTANRCVNPEDANWTSPVGNWAWEGHLLGARVSGPGASMIDATFAYGFGRLQGLLPAEHDRRLPRRLLLVRLRRGAGHGRTGRAGLPRPGNPRLRVHDRQQPERARSRSGRARPPRRPHPWVGETPRGRPGILTPCLGSRRGRQSAARLVGGPTGRRRAHRGPGYPVRLARRRQVDHRHRLPDRRRTSVGTLDPFERRIGPARIERPGAGGPGAVPGTRLRPQHRLGFVGHHRPRLGHGDRGSRDA